MNNSFLQDGTGKGYLAQVDDDNRLRTFSVTESLFNRQATIGESFNINTENRTISSSAQVPLLYFRSTESNDVVLVNWFIGVDANGATFPGAQQGIMRVYANPTSVTGGTSLSILNRKVGSTRSFSFAATYLPTWTPTGTPLLYQHQGTGRVFGEINVIVPRGGSVIVTYEFPTYSAGSPLIYTGFTGYVTEEAR